MSHIMYSLNTWHTAMCIVLCTVVHCITDMSSVLLFSTAGSIPRLGPQMFGLKPMSRLSRPHHCDGVDDMSYVGNQLNLRSWRLLGFFDNFLALDANGTDSLSTR